MSSTSSNRFPVELDRRKSRVVLELFDLLLVRRHLLHERLPLFLELVLLLQDELSQELVLEADGGDGEVDDVTFALISGE